MASREGKIYINDKRLDTFYGEAHRLGTNLEAFEEIPETPHIDDRASYVEQVFKFSMKAIVVPEGELFVAGDDWLRSKDSRYLGPIPRDRIQGKVVGVCNSCS